MTRFTIVVAMTVGGIIGRDGRLPWSYPADMKHFVRVTVDPMAKDWHHPRAVDHAVIMGRTTWRSLRHDERPLHNRMNVVVSRTMKKDEELVRYEGRAAAVWVCRTPDEAMTRTNEKFGEVFIIGGASMYEAFLREGWVDRMLITEVPSGMIQGDTYFPMFRRDDSPNYPDSCVPGVWNLEQTEIGPGPLVVHEFVKVES